MNKKIAVVQFPGSNCENESLFALRRSGIGCEEFLWNASVEKLKDFGGYFIVGGFSYEDRSRAGVIASLDPVMKTILAESKKGKPVLGICNGAQVLVETGMVPGYASDRLGMVLAPNRMEVDGKIVGVGYYNDYCYLKTGLKKGSNAFNRKLNPDQLIRVPFAHAEGRFMFEPGLMERMQQSGMLAFRYVDSAGNQIEGYPINPNGSQGNVAAVVNASGNVMAMMPHPERLVAGDPIFESMGEYLAGLDVITFHPVYLPEPERKVSDSLPKKRVLDENKIQIPVKLIITDTTAYSVEDALGRLGFRVKVDRWVLWTIETDGNRSKTLRSDLIASGELLNTNKEWVDDVASLHSGEDGKSVTFIVETRDEPFGPQRMQNLRTRFGMNEIKGMRRRVVWKVSSDGQDLDLAALVSTHIFHNPVVDTLDLL
jgi:phosphoribosylformylglycinamidine synthase subunit PurQ / glutaminase